VTGLGVPAAPSFLELDDEETVAYNARRTPAVSLPALRAECFSARDAEPIALNDEDLELVPSTPASVAPSVRLAPPRSLVRVSLATKAKARTVPSERENGHQRVGVSSRPQNGREVRVHASQERSLLPKLSFLAVLVMALMVLATEISIRRNLPWLDCRPYLVKCWRLVAERIPWDRLPKWPHF
jgi:hypothetical protein